MLKEIPIEIMAYLNFALYCLMTFDKCDESFYTTGIKIERLVEKARQNTTELSKIIRTLREVALDEDNMLEISVKDVEFVNTYYFLDNRRVIAVPSIKNPIVGYLKIAAHVLSKPSTSSTIDKLCLQKSVVEIVAYIVDIITPKNQSTVLEIMVERDFELLEEQLDDDFVIRERELEDRENRNIENRRKKARETREMTIKVIEDL
jgi:hypothetical protein